MTVFNTRMLKYESTANSSSSNLDYGTVSQVINDKLINVNMGGSNYTLESVGVANGYIPKLGDWVVVEWQNGSPVANGSSVATTSSGLVNINTPTIVSQSDLASGTINGDHIRTNSIDADHIQAGSVTALAISANSIQTQHISANSIAGYQIQAGVITAQNISANTITSAQIQAGSITTQSISANSITTNLIQANAVTATQISANAVTTSKIQAGAITSQLISANSVQTQHISANSIQGNQIQAGTITTTNLSANSITSSLIQANAVQAIQISANAVQTGHISANTITTSQIKAGQITTALISANSIVSSLISAGAIQTQHISANSITSGLISANAIQTQHISANTIATNQIQAGAITTALISANSITSNLITANAIQTQHISSNSISGGQIMAGTITGQNVQAGSISGTSIASNTITAVNLSANSVTSYQISANSVQTQHISANSIMANQIGANQINATHISANSITAPMIQANAVTTNAISANSITSAQISANSIQTQHISANTITTNQIQANAITSSLISANTINAGHLQANSVTASAISANSIQTQHISANTVTTAQIQAGAITTLLLSANAITADKIQAGAITTAQISANSITSSLIQAGAITSNLISANAIQTQHISANTITTSQIQAGQITTNLISANTITSALIQSNAIQTQHISSNTINTSQIQAGAITSSLISSNAIQTQHISANSILGTQIQANQIGSNLITANAIQAIHISANAVQTQHISANTITTGQIQANAIQAQNISANAIQTQHISANTINTAMIQAGTITSNLISANAIQTQHISANSITGAMIQANTINGNNIMANAIQVQHISANAVQANQISANAVQVQHISASAVQANQISANAVQTQHISSNSIQTRHISANTITTSMIQAQAITSALITANAITSTLIASNAVQAIHISANAVTSYQISANSVQSQHISANAVQTQHISANTITTAMIQANAITTNLITANAITTNQISSNSVMGYQIVGNQVSANHIVVGAIQTQHISANTINAGMLQANSVTTNAISANSVTTNQISSNAIQTRHISANTIQGYMIQANQISANSITANAINATHITANAITSQAISANAVQVQHISANSVTASQISANAVQTQHISANSIMGYQIQANQISANQIVANSITAQQMQVGTITAQSGILASGSIQTANIADGIIVSAKIGNGEIKTANIASGNITNVLIANATIDYTKINSVDASKITVGQLNGSIITAGTISGNAIQAGTITGDRLVAGSIDSTQIKAGAIITNKIAAGAITSAQIQAGAVTTDSIRAGSITAEQISTVGLDAQILSVYNSATGETLIGGGYLRVDGLDNGVVQSDNLMKNGLFLASSTNYGYIRMNPSGEALLGNTKTGLGSHQIWKIDLTTGFVVKTIDIPSKQPVDVVIHPSGNYAYITVQGDNTLSQIDLSQDMLTSNKLPMGIGPSRAKFTGMQLMDMKHIFVLNTDPNNAFTPDSMTVIDTPPDSVNSDLYVHHHIQLGTNPYDFVIDSDGKTWVTLAGAGEVVMVDTSHFDSHYWKVQGRIPITAYGTDLLHGGLDATFGLQEVTGGDASGQYNDNMSGQMNMTASDSASGYGGSDGSLRTYSPHGIEQSSDADTLYVVDNINGELVVIDKLGSAPYNALIGSSADGSFQGSSANGNMSGMNGMGGMGASPATFASNGEDMGGGPGTYYVRYRIPVGNSPEFVSLINGKLFITLSGDNSIAVINESDIISQINADRSFYGTYNNDGTWTNWNVMQPMRTVTLPTPRIISNIGTNPTNMKVLGSKLYVSLSNQAQIAIVDTNSEKVTTTINVGTNPRGFDFTPDGKYMYVANYGGVDNLSFIYPQGTYIGDPYMALEGGISYQGADGWSPDRSNWVYDASGNIQSKSVIEFHINEPFLNEGGFAKLQSFGIDPQYAKIEQDIVNVTNYSNGNNVVNVIQGTLNPDFSGNIWSPKEGMWVSNPTVKNINICSLISGSVVKTQASANTYTVNYGTWGNGNSNITFSANAVPSGNWVEADYTSPNNIYFATQNSSIEVAIDNGSSPNFDVSYQIDEYIPKFVVVDNQQTSSFTPTADGISDTYTGLEYSTITNRSIGSIGSSSKAQSSSADLGGSTLDYSLINSGYEPDQMAGDMIGSMTPMTSGNISLSGNSWVQLDLQDIYMVSKIAVSHMYGADRVYHNTKTQVSEDGVVWTTVYDSSVSGEYNEKPYFDAMNNVTNYAKIITFNALPVRYVRDYANGWTSGDGKTSGNSSDWTLLNAYGDWKFETGYAYPSNSPKAGKQIATNGKGVVTTDVDNAWVAMDIQIEYTSWWYMTYVVGPQFGKLKVDMPSMGMHHFLTLTSPFVNNVAHRHIMSFPPSAMIQADMMNNIKAGKHRVVISQVSGKISIDRFRFEDYQYYNRSTLSIPTNTSATLFTRYKVIAEQAQWYAGQGRQTTEGAYDTPRTNPDTGLQDYSVPLKYRVRLLAELSPVGNVQEQGTVYATSAIFEKGKLSTHWRRSESSDVVPAHQIETWNGQQPFTTGIQNSHLADGVVTAQKILVNSIMDWNISNYARIQEHKLELNYPTHAHGWYDTIKGAGPMGTDLQVWNDNLAILDTIKGWAGTSGNYGTGNVMARGDHSHDGQYLSLATGGIVNSHPTFTKGIDVNGGESHFSNGTYADPSIGQGFGLKVSQGIATDKLNVSGNIVVTGNIIVTGTVDNADISVMSGNLYGHIGSGNTAHPVAVSGGVAGFIDGTSYAKLLNIQSNAINQSTTDTLYAQLSGGNLNNTTIGKSLEHGSASLILGNNDWTPLIKSVIGGTIPTNVYYSSANKGVTISGSSVWIKVRARLPIDPESTYFLRAKVTKLSGSGGVYIGADTLDSNYNTLSTDQAQSYNYFGASSVTIASGNSQYFEATISGYNTTSGGAVNKFDPSGNYFDLVLIGNYGGSGATTFEWLEIYKAPNTGYIGSSLIATQPWVTGNYYTQSYINSVLVDATETTHGFLSTSDKTKLDGIQSTAINQTTADGRYVQLSGSTMSGALTLNNQLIINQYNAGIQFNLGAFASSVSGSQWWHGPNGSGDNILQITKGGSGNSNYSWYINGTDLVWTQKTLGTDPATKTWISGNYYNTATTDGKYLPFTGGIITGTLKLSVGNTVLGGDVNGGIEIGRIDGTAGTPFIDFHTGSGNDYDVRLIATGGLLSGNGQGSLNIASTGLTWNSNTIATQAWVTGNYYTQSYLNGILVDASETTHGFLSTSDKTKLDGIQSSSINQTTADGRYLQISGSTVAGNLVLNNNIMIEGKDVSGNVANIILVDGSNNTIIGTNTRHTSIHSSDIPDLLTASGTYTLATQQWVSGNYYTQSYLNGVLIDATETTHGFMSTADKIKLDGIQSSAMNQTSSDARYLQLTGGVLSGSLNVTGNITVTGTVDGVDVSVLSGNVSTLSGNIATVSGNLNTTNTNVSTLSGNIVTVSGNLNTTNTNLSNLSGSVATISGNLNTTNTNVSTLSGNIATVSGNLITTNSNVSVLSGNIVALSGNLNTTNNNVSNISANVNVLSGNIATVSGNLITTNSSVSLISGNVNVLSGNIATVSGNLNTTNNNVANISANVNILSGNIATISGNLNTTNTNVSNISGNVNILSGNIATISGNLSTLSGNVSVLSGNIATVSGNLNITNSNVSTISGNLYSHIGSGGSAHAVAISGGANGFIDGTNYGKLLRIQDNAINQATADARYLNLTGGTISGSLTLGTIDFVGGGILRNGGANNTALVMSSFSGGGIFLRPNGDNSTDSQMVLTSGSVTFNGNQLWHAGNLPDPATKTWISGNYYNSTTVDQKVASRGDVFQANANTFTNTNTFSNGGLGIKVQPSGSVSNTTKLLQINNASSTEIFSVNYSGGVYVLGDLTVTGQTKYAGTTQVDGDYSVSGNMFVSGNTTLGNASTDTTTVNGTLVISGNIEQIGYYQEVHRRPLFGIAGDLQFKTNDTTLDSVVYNYDPTAYGLPSVQTGATRYYRLYVIYSDDITNPQASGGQQSNLMYSANTTMSWTLPLTWGGVDNRRDWYTPYFTGLPTGHSTIYAGLAQSGNNLGIRWIELIAYDKF